MIPLERVLGISNILDWLLINHQHPLGSIVMFQTSIFQVTLFRGVTRYLKLGGQAVMWHVVATATESLFCQKLVGQLPTLSTSQLHPCLLLFTSSWHYLTLIGIKSDTFISFWFLDLILSADFFFQNFTNFLEVKIGIKQIILIPCPAYWVFFKLPLGGAKDEHFPPFQRSCQFRVNAFQHLPFVLAFPANYIYCK